MFPQGFRNHSKSRTASS